MIGNDDFEDILLMEGEFNSIKKKTPVYKEEEDITIVPFKVKTEQWYEILYEKANGELKYYTIYIPQGMPAQSSERWLRLKNKGILTCMIGKDKWVNLKVDNIIGEAITEKKVTKLRELTKEEKKKETKIHRWILTGFALWITSIIFTFYYGYNFLGACIFWAPFIILKLGKGE